MRVRVLDPRVVVDGREADVPVMGLGHVATFALPGAPQVAGGSEDICPFCEEATLTPDKRKQIAEKLAVELEKRAADMLGQSKG